MTILPFPILRYFFSLFLCLFFFGSTHAQDLYNSQHSLEFANYLFTSKQYQLATQEYERVLFLGEKTDSIKLQIVRSLSLNNQKPQALQRAKSLYDHDFNNFPTAFSKHYVSDLFTLQDFTQLNYFLQQPNTLGRRAQVFCSTSMFLHNLNWKGASLSTELARKEQMKETDFFEKMTFEGQNIEYKSPLLATTLSTFIPGTGKLYTGDWQDGIFSLLLVGGTAFQAYRGFKNKGVESIRGWVFGAIALGFYTGNIWGSFRSAKKYNNRKNAAFKTKVNDHFKKNF